MRNIFILITLLCVTIAGCANITQPSPAPEVTQVEPELTIPTGYTTYTSEAQLFSISYPSDWETALSLIPDLEKDTKSFINNYDAGIPLNKYTLIFLAGRRTPGGFSPNVNIGVEPIPYGTKTYEQVAEAEEILVAKAIPGYRVFSRMETTVDGRKVRIDDAEGALEEQGEKSRILMMMMLVDKTVWQVTCGSTHEEFAKMGKGMLSVVRSLRVKR